MFKAFILFILFCIILFVIGYFALRKQPIDSTTLNGYIEKLESLQTTLKSISTSECIKDIDLYKTCRLTILKIINLDSVVKDIIKNQKASDESLKKFNDMSQSLLSQISIMDKMVNCTDYCYNTKKSDVCSSVLDDYTKLLQSLQTTMKSITTSECIKDVDKYKTCRLSILKIINVDSFVKDIIQNRNASDESLKKFNDISSELSAQIDSIDKMKSCNEYCYQGKFENDTCKCKDPLYPTQIKVDGKNYCWKNNCDSNNVFIPGNKVDPVSNSCICKDTFITSPSGKCETSDTISLETLTNVINKLTNEIVDKCKVCKNEVYDKNSLQIQYYDTVIAQSNLKSGNASEESISAYKNAKLDSDKKLEPISLFPSCNNYCYQGTFENDTCQCKDPLYPNQIKVDDKNYCSKIKCEQHLHIEGKAKDSSSNKCVCDEGFVYDPTHDICIDICGVTGQIFNKETKKCEKKV